MGRIEKGAVRLISVLLIIISVTGISFIWTRQGTDLMARYRLKSKNGSLMKYIGRENKHENAITSLHSLCIRLPKSLSQSAVSIKSDSRFKEYHITIPSVSSSYFADYPVSGNGRSIKSLKYQMSGRGAVLTLTTTKPLFIKKSSDSSYLFFDFKEPRKCFDKVVLVDAGHGGSDRGTVAGGVSEKDISLSIVKYFKHFTDKKAVTEVKEYGTNLTSMKIKGVGKVGFFYTRLSDKTISDKDRIEEAKKIGADLFLSVETGSTASGRESEINGAQVLYRGSDKTSRSRKFADTVLKKLLSGLKCEDRGSIAGDEHYIVSASKIPVAIAEVGFITNKAERKKLVTADYQKKAAKALVEAVSEYLSDSGHKSSRKS
ncbi:MAG: N-acetylmuramoyl-L-alanine amidase [Lachnospiraceae bacterium]|uniref:N-acetylmuramoyl-L-alanine amidase n=1 Tax=Candidatus Weimeria bifida TaxID=2599074 RepID=A0A6N7IZK1_9FIRM|nr:N-acetylmuramoyl-L-alanine amidase [Candidatus Weimeria bifida]RRF96562.1 MAG: N-acetylmuramoyl-L-alanine amidase [Lachnospiraceae bacterium]